MYIQVHIQASKLHVLPLDYWHTKSGTYFHLLYIFVKSNNCLCRYYSTCIAWWINKHVVLFTKLHPWIHTNMSKLWTPVEMHGLVHVIHNQLHFGPRCTLGYSYRKCALAANRLIAFVARNCMVVFLICLSLVTVSNMYLRICYGVCVCTCCWLYRVMSNVWEKLQRQLKLKFPLTWIHY